MIEEDVNLLRKLAWQAARTTGLDFEDMFSEACIVYLEAEKRYDPSKSSKSTFIWSSVSKHLRTLTNTTEQSLPLTFDAIDESIDPEKTILMQERWNELIASLSPEAQYIVERTLETSRKGLPIDKPKVCRGIIMRQLREEGWSWSNIWRGFKELKAATA